MIKFRIPRGQKLIFGGIIFCILIWLLGTALAWWQLHTLLDHHVPNTAWKPSDIGLTYEEARFKAIDGTALAGWYVPVATPKAGVVIVPGFEEVQGGKNEPFITQLVQPLHNAGYAVLMLDPRGYGASEGSRIYLGSKEWMDAAAAYDYLKGRDELKQRPVGFIGDSMGATTVIATAGRTGKGDFIIASVPQENFATTFRTWAKSDGYPSFFAPFINSAAYFFLGLDYPKSNPDALLEKIQKPIMLIGAEHDDVVGTDIEHLFTIANEPKRLWRPAGSTHELVDQMAEAYHRHVLDFLAQLAQ